MSKLPGFLEPEERERFGTYAAYEAKSLASLADQMKKLGDNPVMAQLIKQKEVEAMAFKVVALVLLRPVETQTIT